MDAHVVACEALTDSEDAGEETDLCHSDRNGEGGAGPAVEQPLTWDDEDVAAPERFFLPLQEPDAHFPDACKQLVRCHFSCCSLRKLLPSNGSLHQ